MVNRLETILPRSEASRPATKHTICGVLGAVVLGLIGTGFLLVAVFAVIFGGLLVLLGSVAAVGLVWLVSKRVRWVWLRILVRAFALALVFTPFIPHRSVEWSSPWPPAGFWLLASLKAGKLELFELVPVLVVTLLGWWGGLAVYRDRHRQGTAEPGAPPNDGPATPPASSRVTEGPSSVS